MPFVFDSHAHYYDARFADEIPGGADAILQKIQPDPVRWILNVGTNNQTSRAAAEQAKKYAGMFAAVGIHPEDCLSLSCSELEFANLRSLLEKRREEKIVAIGEIGLDYHMPDCHREKQQMYFERQLTYAEEFDLPVVIHDRDAHGDCFETVLRHPDVCGVFHSYSGSLEMARELCRRGWYLSFSGVLTFKNAERVRTVAASVPDDRILIETDCPYLAPHPCRGKCNHSGWMADYTLPALAAVRGVSPETLATQTAENAKRLFGI